MAEAEEVITDAARHATVFAQRLWRRHRPPACSPPVLSIAQVSERLDLLVSAFLGHSVRLRVAQTPARLTWLARWYGRGQPMQRDAMPATDGASIWLPQSLGIADHDRAFTLYKAMALLQAARIHRGSASVGWRDLTPLAGALYRLIEAHACERHVLAELPGFAGAITALRAECLVRRPPSASIAAPLRSLDARARRLLAGQAPGFACTTEPGESLSLAKELLEYWQLPEPGSAIREPLYVDWWLGGLLEPLPVVPAPGPTAQQSRDQPARSTRLQRRPEVRKACDDEQREDERGPLMVQLDEPHPHAEDPMGLQRPIDRDEDDDAQLYGELVSELKQARLVNSPGRPAEVLLSDDPPDSPYREGPGAATSGSGACCYPEWDYRAGCYVIQGARVREGQAGQGSRSWVEHTLETHQALIQGIKRRFELLRARRLWLRKQPDGDELDLDAYVEAAADQRAGHGLGDRLYRLQRAAQRDQAILLLIDISGSTDSWIAAGRRVIDVEREALLLVCIALQSLAVPYAVQAFSGQGREGVVVRRVKDFDEAFDEAVALRIAALEPEHFTRCGAAIRHATASLMTQQAGHRLLLMLSDGKPSDDDAYGGRYGVEDSRQAVIEASLQGVSPFCLTIDRQAGAYLPRIFGASRYALLPRAELLPTVLLDWMRRLLQG